MKNRLNMKNLVFISIAILLSSCMAPREITEQYIKNKVEKHVVGQAQTSVTYSIYKGLSSDQTSYLEMTGFKQGTDRKLIIGVDKYYKLRPNFTGEQTTLAKIFYLELNMSEFALLYSELVRLEEKAASQTAGKNETVYLDFTITPDFFISSSKYYTASPGMFNVDLWINGEKFVISSNQLFDQLEKFKKWILE